MDSSLVMEVFQNTFSTVLKIAVPLLGISMLVGLIIAILQAATQVHEQTLTFVPKLFVIALLLIALGNVMIGTMTDFFLYIMQVFVSVS